MQNTKPVKLFIDWASQPSRAIVIFCNITKIPHEIVETRVFMAENRKPEYAKINPDKRVPALFDQENNFPLFESHAIMRYLADSRQVSDHLYPKNVQSRAKVDSYLDWHHTNTRKCGWLIFNTLFAPMLGLKTFLDLKQLRGELELKILKFIDSYYLKNAKNGKFIHDQDQFSIADISCYCELIQLKFLEFKFDNYPNITFWMKKMSEIPEVQQGHVTFEKLAQASIKQQKKQKQEAKL